MVTGAIGLDHALLDKMLDMGKHGEGSGRKQSGIDPLVDLRNHRIDCGCTLFQTGNDCIFAGVFGGR